MFPLKDENPTELVPYVTFAIIVLNVLVWLIVEQAGGGQAYLQAVCRYASVPGEITGALSSGAKIQMGPYSCPVGGLRWETLVTSMFLHGSWMHLIGNMWFFWVFGNNIEDSMGHGRFAVFYLLCGLIAAGAHILSAPNSSVPTLGASGAISGVMGGYLLLFPRVRIYTLFFFFLFIRIILVPAWVILGEWFFVQLVSGTMSAGAAGGGVAFWAHVGGFVAGLALIRLFARNQRLEMRHA